MSPFYVDHLRKHACAIRYLPPANKKASAHALCMKIVGALQAANDPKFVKPVVR